MISLKVGLSPKTIMIPKEKKPTAHQLRPIALTDTSYKIFMGLIKKEIENYLENNQLLKETQAGFTKKRRIEDNLFILNECKDMAFKKKKQLITGCPPTWKTWNTWKSQGILKGTWKTWNCQGILY